MEIYQKKREVQSSIHSLAEHNRPREKMKLRGASSLSDTELLALFIKSGTAGNDVMSLARLVGEVVDLSPYEQLFERLLLVEGIGEVKAASVCALFEYARRKLIPSQKKIGSPSDIYPWLWGYAEKKQEHFIVFCLNGNNEIQSRRVVTVGLLNSSQIHPREVFAPAVLERAASVILAHNHPSGNLIPSEEDLKVTERLRVAGDILGIPVLDHIIFSMGGFYSFLQHGRIG